MVEQLYGVIIVKHYTMTLNQPAVTINRTYVLNRLMFKIKLHNNGYFNSPILF